MGYIILYISVLLLLTNLIFTGITLYLLVSAKKSLRELKNKTKIEANKNFLYKHPRSHTKGNVPSNGSISEGEIGINTEDGILYTIKPDGKVIRLGPSYEEFLELQRQMSKVNRFLGGKVR